MSLEVLRPYEGSYDVAYNTHHNHYDRCYRQQVIEDLCASEGAIPMFAFLCDSGHKNGLEIHWVFSNGIIAILNEFTHCLVTYLIARPAQIIRYFKACHWYAPRSIVDYARQHRIQGLNHC